MLAHDIRAIWIASVPRTGSMWTFNVVRDLVRLTGRPVQPELVPHDDAEMEAIGRAGLVADDGIYVLKVHTRLATDLPHSLFVVTRRDVRDSLVSFMRFTRSDFTAGLRFVAGALRLEQHFSAFPAERRVAIAYDDILARPQTVVTTLASRLGIELAPGAAEAIVARYAKGEVQARIVAREQALRDRIGAGEAVDVRDFVPMPDRSVRAFDTATGFQSGHVSNYREGDWRRLLTAAQQQAVAEVIAEFAGRAGPLA